MTAAVPGPMTCRQRASLAVAVGLLSLIAARGATASAPTPTPGPAERVGGTLDRGWSQVSRSVGEALLIARVRVALLERLKEDGLRVTIDAQDGNIELSGRVEKPENVDLAGRVAGSVDGVRSVKSRVALVADGQTLEPPVAHALGKVEHGVADALLEARVKALLLSELGKVAFKVGVDANNGVVTLSGTVPDADRRKLATAVVRSTSGVKEVRDLMTVKE
ncbi:MAG: BON domain-containing protein [Thermoanaerobaculaceae bacterium]|jgi:osmotically-inducible protein OsmY